MQTKSPYIVYQAKGKQTQMLFMDTVLLILSVSLLYLGQQGANSVYLVSGISGMVLFGCLLLFLLRRFVRGKVLLKVTKEGFYDYSSWSSAGNLIKWSNVGSLSEGLAGGQTFISVKLTNETEYLASLPPYKRLLVQANIKLTDSPIKINLQTARFATSHEVLDVIETYLQ